ncbi:MAG: protein-disulfide reductase DsbD [Oxalicibacterium faecigallinarum]|uniref:protein-disulfide reductase DsbD n=1 Tax=Oxalicibacterium faecigallinarum TaxID=573741 RepID=UPI0028068604|nr:protein-disulfide reductase DsbD [Oxalicibacterium faecigallinarum]MDQ7970014.1 protein-disulfide reductase DsbD [Oxalicibacterium faecigallinarum]
MLLCTVLLFVASILPARAAPQFLEPDKAFVVSARMTDASTLEVRYQIADGYYMYRQAFGFLSEEAVLNTPAIPDGKVKFDETFQKEVETYREEVRIHIPVQADQPFVLASTSQGCSDQGLCYPPMTALLRVPLDGSAAVRMAEDAIAGLAPPKLAENQTEMGRIERSLQSGRLLMIAPLFFLLGLGLAFTPCVLPMLPILSSIIVGEGAQVSRKRGFLLAMVYSLGMAIVYTALGTAAGLIGEGLAATLQKPWVLTAFALLMVGLALAMFDVYQLQMPAAIQSRLSGTSGRQTAGKLSGVFTMGALSALIVGPCVAAPLAGALVYISQTRDVVVGASALFSMAMGMSVPLLLLGLSAGTLLPRAGGWMDDVKRFFGVLMLGVALWMVSPVLPDAALMLGWAALGIGYGAYLLWARAGWIAKACGLFFLACGLFQLAGVATGGRDVLAPLGHLRDEAHDYVRFERVKTLDDLEKALARSNGKHVMLDFYADWCVSCIEMEKFTFTQPQVRAHLDQMVLLQVDVTKNDADDKAMLRRFNLFGPPGIIFFDRTGNEIKGGRVIGFQNATKFTESLELIRSF